MARLLIALLVSAFSLVCGAQPQPFPSRTVTLVSPFPPGGSTDAIARIMAQRMGTALGQSVIVENVGGAGGSIALGRVARAASDGYTISVGSGDQFVVNAAIYPLQYDVVQDFEPVSLLMNGPNLIISKNEIPAKNLKELVAWLKANHANVAQGHNGAGGSLHLCGVELQRVTGASWPFVPYRGAAPALQDVIGGRIDVMCTSPASSLEMVRNGLVRGYAITGNTRLATAPDIPTVDEAGFPGFHISVWGGLFAPKGTPAPIVSTLTAAIDKAGATPLFNDAMANIGLERTYLPAAEFAKFWDEDARRAEDTIRQIGKVG
jgi:tripartite-type tricarboxylate transporter receptor subunit TctC